MRVTITEIQFSRDVSRRTRTQTRDIITGKFERHVTARRDVQFLTFGVSEVRISARGVTHLTPVSVREISGRKLPENRRENT